MKKTFTNILEDLTIEDFSSKYNDNTLLKYFEKYNIDVKPLDDPQYIGNGAFSTVYLLNDNWVFKYSEEVPEKFEKIIKSMVGKEYKYIAKIIYAQKLPFIINNIYPFVIVQEYVKQSLEDYFNMKNAIYLEYIISICMDYSKKSLSIQDKIKEIKEKHLYGKNKTDAKLLKFIHQLYEGLSELKNVCEIEYTYDIHIENIKIDKNGNIKIIDF